ncbi:hypothetical protein COCON_G00161980 [Conger conger]|uniref:Uncharacterized protein n=1 Tax=Conger conger TaxID=82655 RepID=A0A9Q1D6S7_CONCO|nr:hypothetical protein COCON_G00161980 [Conger conger]
MARNGSVPWHGAAPAPSVLPAPPPTTGPPPTLATTPSPTTPASERSVWSAPSPPACMTMTCGWMTSCGARRRW